MNKYIQSLIIGGLIVVGAGLTATITTLQTANDGDVITAQAWNALVDQINSGGSSGSGTLCTSEGQLGCTIDADDSQSSSWTCSYGWNSSTNKCNTMPTIGTQDNPGQSCKHIRNLGVAISGVYYVALNGGLPFEVYCDMVTDRGGWTVLFKNHNPLMWMTDSGGYNGTEFSIDSTNMDFGETEIMDSTSRLKFC